MCKKKIYVIYPMDDHHRKQLAEKAPNYEIIYDDHADTKQIETAHIIMGNPHPESLKNAKNLEWLQLFSAGSNRYAEADYFPKQASLTNASGAYGLAISEHMVGTALMLQKNLHLYRDSQMKVKWEDHGPVTSMENAHVLIIGLGDIGSMFAQKVKALGAYTVGIKRTPSKKPDWLDELYTTGSLDEVLSKADIVALTLPENKETRNLLNKERIDGLKPHAMVLNVGRGSAIDTDALYQALKENRLMGAGLDVFPKEPLPADHPLWKMKNVLITPHVSGGLHLPQTRERIMNIFLENLERFEQNKPLRNQVDFKTGYRKSPTI